MNPIQNKTYKFKGHNDRLIAADLTYTAYPNAVPIAVFVHGFKGFKDWGAWPLAAEIFAIKGIPFFKFNFSHNGTTPANPTEFVDLEAFAENNLKIEYDEIGTVIDFIERKSEQFGFTWNQEIYLIGHSRGAGVALARAINDTRITKCASWAGVADLSRYISNNDLEQWEKNGKHIVVNGRTGQEMPMNFQFVEAFRANRELFDIEAQLDEFVTPFIMVHGDDDNVVPISESHRLFQLIEHSILLEIEGADHTFNIRHPLTERKVTKAFAEAVSETIEFFEM